MKNSLENAQKLYEAGDYHAAAQMCGELMDSKENLSSILTLAAKSFIFCMSTPLKKEMHETLYLTVGNACRYAEDIQAVEQIRYDIEMALREWKVKCVRDFFEALKSNPLLEYWRAYIEYAVAFIEIELFISAQISNCPLLKKIKEQADYNQEEYNKKYILPLPEDTTAREIDQIEYSAAQQIYSQTKALLSENDSGTPDFMIEISKRVNQGFVLSGLIFSSTQKFKHIDTTTKCNRIKQLVECKLAYLDATVYPNGQAVSVLGVAEQRQERIAEINELVKEIRLIDPDYQLPSQPNPTPLAVPQTSSGCYVATAVYGSYDCPEVWTLRRFRDYTLASTWYGRTFIHLYYGISPTLVKWFGHAEWFKKMWKGKLDRMVQKLNRQGVESTPYQDRDW